MRLTFPVSGLGSVWLRQILLTAVRFESSLGNVRCRAFCPQTPEGVSAREPGEGADVAVFMPSYGPRGKTVAVI